MRRLIYSPRILLPLMLVVGFLILGVRLNDLGDTLISGHLFAPRAFAETKPDEHGGGASGAEDYSKAASTPAPDFPPAPPAPSSSGGADEGELSPTELDVLKQLSGRREELDKRAKQLDMREALTKVAEQRVDQKIQDLESLKQQLQVLVNQAGEEQAAQLDNLVKIYETMKPDDAAHIFETLDMPVLLNVIKRMKPKSTAPIMAKMAPERAKEITIALTRQDKLPQIK